MPELTWRDRLILKWGAAFTMMEADIAEEISAAEKRGKEAQIAAQSEHKFRDLARALETSIREFSDEDLSSAEKAFLKRYYKLIEGEKV